MQPIPPNRLKQITNDACDSALTTATAYDHAATKSWNDHIINSILKALISESTSASESSSKYKFAVNSTIIQHLSDPRSEGTEAGTQTEGKGLFGGTGEDGVSMGDDQEKKVGRRGMHSASGAYWNNDKDGMWSHKYEGGESKGMDIVVSILWIAV